MPILHVIVLLLLFKECDYIRKNLKCSKCAPPFYGMMCTLATFILWVYFFTGASKFGCKGYQVMGEITPHLRPVLQKYWDEYWNKECSSLCSLCETHRCEEAQRDSGFILSPEITAKPMGENEPYDMSEFYTVCELHGWQVRTKFNNARFLSMIINDCLQDLAKSVISGIQVQIEQQMLFKLLHDINEENSEALSIITISSTDIPEQIRNVSASFSENNIPETGRWIIIDSSMKHLLLETKEAAASEYLREAVMNGTNPYYGFRFFTLDTSRFSDPFNKILNGRLIFFHASAVGCAYTSDLATNEVTTQQSVTHFDCEFRFGAVTNNGARTGQIFIPAS